MLQNQRPHDYNTTYFNLYNCFTFYRNVISLHNKRPSVLLRLMSKSNVMRELQQAFSDSEEFYVSVLESLGEGILITDAQSRVLYANSRMEEISGYSREELKRNVTCEILSPP